MSQFQFIPSTRDLLSFLREQDLTPEQQDFVREKIGAGLIVREVDSNPIGTVTTLVFQNGTVSIVDGVATITGLQGANGATGATGAQGSPGATGATGAAGPNLVSTATATNITGPIVGNGSTIIAGSFGTTAGTFCEGNDSRLSNARTPTAHNHAASDINSGTLPVARGGTGLTAVGSALQVMRTNAAGNALEFATPLGGSTGATDNRVLRSDGTGGATLQNSSVTIDDSGNVTGVAALTASGDAQSTRVVIMNGAGRGVIRLAGGSNEIFQVGADNANTNQMTVGRGALNGINCMETNSSGLIRLIGNSEVARFSTAGNLSVGGTSDNGARVQVTGNATVSGALQVGGGTAIQNILSATATLDFASIAASSFQDLTITVTGAVSGDTVIVNPIAGSATNDVVYTGWVSASNTVTIRASNVSATTARDPASGTFRATVIRF